MYIHGPRMLADRVTTDVRVALQKALEHNFDRAQQAPTSTRLQRVVRTARQGAVLGGTAGAQLPATFVSWTNFAHVIDPASRAEFGMVRLGGFGPQVPTMIAVWFTGLMLGYGKERAGINMNRPAGVVAGTVVSQYGLLGLPEFGLAFAAARLRAQGAHRAAGACAAGAWLLGLALEPFRLAYGAGTTVLSLACAVVFGTAGALLGAVVGALRPRPPEVAYADAACASAGKAGVQAASGRHVSVRRDLVAYLSGQKDAEGLRAALASCNRDEATRVAHGEALDALTIRLTNAAKQRREPIDLPDTVDLTLLECLVGPLADADDFAAAYRQRSLWLHPDRVLRLQLDAPSELLVGKAWYALQAGNDLAQATRTMPDLAQPARAA